MRLIDLISNYDTALSHKAEVDKWIDDFASAINTNSIEVIIETKLSNAPIELNAIIKRYILTNKSDILNEAKGALNSSITNKKVELVQALTDKITDINRP